MNNKSYKLKNIKPVLLHEFGHLFGYCLANKNDETFFCRPIEIGLGYKNFITPSKKIYHIENLMQDREQVFENTKNIKKTIAWFIEVISGCDFETEYEKTNFDFCFCSNSRCSGSLDFGNLSVIRNISFFKWSFAHIFALQDSYRKLLLEYNIYIHLNEFTEEFLKEYGEKDFHIIEKDELQRYIEKFNNLISEELNKSYLKLIEEFEKILSDE